MADEVKPKNAYKISLLLSFIDSIIVFFYLLSSTGRNSIDDTEDIFAFSKLVFIPLLGLYVLGYVYMRSTGMKKTIVGWVMILEPLLLFSYNAFMLQPTLVGTCGSGAIPIKSVLYLRYVIEVLFIILLPYIIFNSSLFYLLKSKKEFIWSFVIYLLTILVIGILLIWGGG